MVAASLSALMVVGMMSGQTADFDMEGVRARAETVDPRGFLLQGRDLGANEWEQGLGMVTIDATDRARLPSALYGDQARVEAHFRIGAARYRILLEKPGFPPRKVGGRGVKPPHEVGGGVMVNTWINGPAGIGNVLRPAALASVVVWGVGRIERDGRLLSDSVMIEAGALNWGYHADDQTHRVLTAARDGDAEIYVRVTGIPRNREARGFLEISFDDVAVTVNGTPVVNVQNIPSNVISPEAFGGSGLAAGGGAPGTQADGLAADGLAANDPQGASAVTNRNSRSFAEQTTAPQTGTLAAPGTANVDDAAAARGDGRANGGNAAGVLLGAANGGRTGGGSTAGDVASPRPQQDASADERSRAPDDAEPIRNVPSQSVANSASGAPNLPPSPPFDTGLRTGVPGLPPGATTPNLGGNAPNPYASQRGFANTPAPVPQPTAVTGGTALTGTPGFASAPASPELLGQTGAGIPPTPTSRFGTFGVPTPTGFVGAGTGGSGFDATGSVSGVNAGVQVNAQGTFGGPPDGVLGQTNNIPVGSVAGAADSPLTITGAPTGSGFGFASSASGGSTELGNAGTLTSSNGLAGTATTGTPPTPGSLAAIGAPTGTGFASPGLPGTPQPLNAQPAAPLPRPDLNINSQPAFGTPLAATPAPLNAQPAPLLPATPTPFNAQPANSVPGAVPGAFGISVLPGQLTAPTATPAGTAPTTVGTGTSR